MIEKIKLLVHNKFVWAVGLTIIGNIIAWWHMNAQFKYNWAKGPLYIALMGLPISFCFYYATRFNYEFFDQRVWYTRPVGFGVATIVFYLLTYLVLGETPDIKVWIALGLSGIIVFLMLSGPVN